MSWPTDWSERIAGTVCDMCEGGTPDDSQWGIRIYQGRTADAVLQRADVRRGYTLVIWRGPHVTEPTQLSAEDSAAYWDDVMTVARGLIKYYQPLKLNYEILGNTTPHLHTHLLPRYLDDPAAGTSYPLHPTKAGDPSVDGAELSDQAADLRRILGYSIL
jgi:diadenosine tetraphosphate (Ap4A) HIT family hydrolase